MQSILNWICTKKEYQPKTTALFQAAQLHTEPNYWHPRRPKTLTHICICTISFSRCIVLSASTSVYPTLPTHLVQVLWTYDLDILWRRHSICQKRISVKFSKSNYFTKCKTIDDFLVALQVCASIQNQQLYKYCISSLTVLSFYLADFSHDSHHTTTKSLESSGSVFVVLQMHIKESWLFFLVANR